MSFGSTYKNWLKQPFSADMTATEWFLFIGLLFLIVGLWNLILYHLVSIIAETE